MTITTNDERAMVADGDTQVYVVDTSAAFRDEIQYLLGDIEVQEATDLDELDLDEPRRAPAVVILGPSQSRAATLARVEPLVRQRPDVGALLVVRKLATGVLQTALRSGVKDVLALPVSEEELLAAAERVAQSLQVQQPARGANRPPGRLITVFSAKGGAGTSVVAANLAAIVARRPDASVALVDFDLQFGDAALLLGLKPDHTMADTIGTDVDAELVAKLLLAHPSGVDLLAAPLDPVLADDVSDDNALHTIVALRQTHSHVVVDTASRLDGLVTTLIDDSDVVVVVAGADVPSVKGAKLTLQALAALPVEDERIRLVINDARGGAGVSVRDVERALDRKVDAVIPADDAVRRSVNRGEPVVLHASDAPSSRAIAGLAADVAPGGDDPVPGPETGRARWRAARSWLGGVADRISQSVPVTPRPTTQPKED